MNTINNLLHFFFSDPIWKVFTLHFPKSELKKAVRYEEFFLLDIGFLAILLISFHLI